MGAVINCRNQKNHEMTLGVSKLHLKTLQWVGCGLGGTRKKMSGNELRAVLFFFSF